MNSISERTKSSMTCEYCGKIKGGPMTHALLTIGYFAACALGAAAVMLYRFDPPQAGKDER